MSGSLEMEQPSLVVSALPLSIRSLTRYRRALGLQDNRAALEALASAVVSGPGWPVQAEVQIVVRHRPAPVLAVVAEEGVLDLSVLQAQAHAVEPGIRSLSYLSYDEVDQAVRRLAGLLVQELGHEAIPHLRLAGLPRGGLVILGLLATYLGVPAAQTGAAGGEGPLVVVDDCALTGARFWSFLAESRAERIIFAHLASHPSLRAAIEARETRVQSCLAAIDLRMAREMPRASWLAAHDRWMERLGPARYWSGPCERICFPWNEPDRLIWNPVANRIEDGWKLVPPSLCLKNRPVAGERRGIQVQPDPRGPWRPAPDVLFGRWKGATFIARLDQHRVARLSESGSAFWWALVESGDPEQAAAALGGTYDVAGEALDTELAEFAEHLRAHGWLESITIS